MRRLTLACAVLVFSGLAITTAEAANLNTLLNTPYSTLDHSTTQKTVFGWNEQPFIFLRFDSNALDTDDTLKITWKWFPTGGPVVSFQKEFLHSFPTDPVSLWDGVSDWNLHKQLGEWTVKTKWWNDGNKGKDTVHFTVTPEPLGALLIMVGGAALAAIVGSKKRKLDLS